MHKILLATTLMALGSTLLPLATGVRYLGSIGITWAEGLMRLSVSYLTEEQRQRVAREMSPAARQASGVRAPREISLTHRG